MTRIAVVHKDKCFPNKCNKECIKSCPVNRSGSDCITINKEINKSAIVEALCSGCSLCPKACPFKAISIINLPEQLKTDPVHRYGENEFALFNLPIPQEGKIVGLVGANGIGKTTALNILSGQIMPNFGKFDKETSQKEIIKIFRGSELQKYFEKLFAKSIEVSYKTQYIDLVPDKFRGTAFDLLQKFGSKAKSIEIADQLGIHNILDRNLKDLSGGELQKAVIAASLLKSASLYFFDEPASYLDIKERIRVAKVLRQFIEGSKKSMLAVEHDLIILDYLAELIHVIFGEKAVYGVVSHPMSAKAGINSYLDGFLKDENMRFRSEPIKFGTTVKDVAQNRTLYVKWPSLKKQLGTFRLDIDASEIFSKEVVGIVGANGIGKTTFMKILAGLITPDEGSITQKVKISYKPQYVKPDSDSTVRMVLSSISKDLFSQTFKINVLTPLDLDILMDKKLSELSGGELQRVAIASCLLRETDLYLFDEPSTYLDVDQRLMAAKAIQNMMRAKEASAIVIDHDLLFVTHISDRLMVFSGKPSESGRAGRIVDVKDGMNNFLRELGITLRRDEESKRPRVNKEGSLKDREQKEKGNYFA